MDTTRDWTQQLTAAGFQLNDADLRIWNEFGDLTINNHPARTPASSLRTDPEDACIETAAEVTSLMRRYGWVNRADASVITASDRGREGRSRPHA